MGTKHYISYSSFLEISVVYLQHLCRGPGLFKDPMNTSNIMLKSEHGAISTNVSSAVTE